VLVNLNNVRREASRYFRNKKKEHLKAKIEELETNSKIKNIWDLYRGISDFKKGYQPRPNTVKDEKGDLITVPPPTIFWLGRGTIFSTIELHGVNYIRLTEIHTVEPVVPEPSSFEVELAIEKLNIHESPGTDQILGEFIKAVGRTICYEIHKLTVSILNKECLKNGRSRSLYLFIRRAIKQTVVIIEAYHFCHLCSGF